MCQLQVLFVTATGPVIVTNKYEALHLVYSILKVIISGLASEAQAKEKMLMVVKREKPAQAIDQETILVACGRVVNTTHNK